MNVAMNESYVVLYAFWM